MVHSIQGSSVGTGCPTCMEVMQPTGHAQQHLQHVSQWSRPNRAWDVARVRIVHQAVQARCRKLRQQILRMAITVDNHPEQPGDVRTWLCIGKELHFPLPDGELAPSFSGPKRPIGVGDDRLAGWVASYDCHLVQ